MLSASPDPLLERLQPTLCMYVMLTTKGKSFYMLSVPRNDNMTCMAGETLCSLYHFQQVLVIQTGKVTIDHLHVFVMC
jgi:hypothetical protein